MRMTTWLVLGLVFALAPLGARADEGYGGKDWKDRGGMAGSLTPDQQAKMKAVGEEQRKTMPLLHDTLKLRIAELRVLVSSKAADAKLTAKLDEVKAAHEALEAARKKFMDQRAAILTPLQRAEMVVRMGDGEGRWEKGEGRGGRGRRGDMKDHDEGHEHEGGDHR